MRVTRKAFEAYLRESGVPYVAVDEVKKALFAGVDLPSFDFVVYSDTGPNLLATCKPFGQGDWRRTMEEWQRVFGSGFAAAEVCRRCGGRLFLIALDGQETELLTVPRCAEVPVAGRGAKSFCDRCRSPGLGTCTSPARITNAGGTLFDLAETMTPWPRLSETLPHPPDLTRCQSCGNRLDDAAAANRPDPPFSGASGAAIATPYALAVWQEHDDTDRPELIYIVLCEACADRIIAEHPRLYRRVDRWAPVPGVMPACIGCRRADGLRCRSPLLKVNGGPGLPIRPNVAVEGFACTRGKGCRRFVQYAHAPECKGFESSQEAATP
jgi:hypothetical protein